jgi:hypothetical protein
MASSTRSYHRYQALSAAAVREHDSSFPDYRIRKGLVYCPRDIGASVFSTKDDTHGPLLKYGICYRLTSSGEFGDVNFNLIDHNLKITRGTPTSGAFKKAGMTHHHALQPLVDMSPEEYRTAVCKAALWGKCTMLKASVDPVDLTRWPDTEEGFFIEDRIARSLVGLLRVFLPFLDGQHWLRCVNTIHLLFEQGSVEKLTLGDLVFVVGVLHLYANHEMNAPLPPVPTPEEHEWTKKMAALNIDEYVYWDVRCWVQEIVDHRVAVCDLGVEVPATPEIGEYLTYFTFTRDYLNVAMKPAAGASLPPAFVALLYGFLRTPTDIYLEEGSPERRAALVREGSDRDAEAEEALLEEFDDNQRAVCHAARNREAITVKHGSLCIMVANVSREMAERATKHMATNEFSEALALFVADHASLLGVRSAQTGRDAGSWDAPRLAGATLRSPRSLTPAAAAVTPVSGRYERPVYFTWFRVQSRKQDFEEKRTAKDLYSWIAVLRSNEARVTEQFKFLAVLNHGLELREVVKRVAKGASVEEDLTWAQHVVPLLLKKMKHTGLSGSDETGVIRCPTSTACSHYCLVSWDEKLHKQAAYEALLLFARQGRSVQVLRSLNGLAMVQIDLPHFKK